MIKDPTNITKLEKIYFNPNLASRNKNFDFYETQEGKKLRKLLKLLNSIKEDIKRSDNIALEKEDIKTSIKLKFTSIHGKRFVRIPSYLFNILLKDSPVREKLKQKLGSLF